MNQYAHSRGLAVDAVIPEPLFSKQFSTTRWSKKSKSLTAIILCSIHQLPTDEETKNAFIDDLHDVEFHFVLENILGKGRVFISQMISEAAIFQQVETIDYKKNSSYEALFQIMKDGYTC